MFALPFLVSSVYLACILSCVFLFASIFWDADFFVPGSRRASPSLNPTDRSLLLWQIPTRALCAAQSRGVVATLHGRTERSGSSAQAPRWGRTMSCGPARPPRSKAAAEPCEGEPSSRRVSGWTPRDRALPLPGMVPACSIIQGEKHHCFKK